MLELLLEITGSCTPERAQEYLERAVEHLEELYPEVAEFSEEVSDQVLSKTVYQSPEAHLIFIAL